MWIDAVLVRSRFFLHKQSPALHCWSIWLTKPLSDSFSASSGSMLLDDAFLFTMVNVSSLSNRTVTVKDFYFETACSICEMPESRQVQHPCQYLATLHFMVVKLREATLTAFKDASKCKSSHDHSAALFVRTNLLSVGLGTTIRLWWMISKTALLQEYYHVFICGDLLLICVILSSPWLKLGWTLNSLDLEQIVTECGHTSITFMFACFETRGLWRNVFSSYVSFEVGLICSTLLGNVSLTSPEFIPNYVLFIQWN